MEFDKQKINDPKKYASRKLPDFTDVTILSTPLPQASSTVDRKSLMQAKGRRSNVEEQNNKHRQLNFDNSHATQNSEESSLGIIQNISSLLDDSTLDEYRSKKDCPERERELARKLLLKCSDSLLAMQSKPDKENNVNSTNLQKISNVHSRPSIKTTQPINSNQRQSTEYSAKSAGPGSIIFEPNEMSARSSELNKSPEKSEPFPPQNFSGISFNSNLAEIMGQFEDDEFMSGSKAGSQILADEISWKKNKLSSIPMSNSSDKERLELSCFSGVIGDIDLTVDGGRVSIGEFFKRKCGGTGHLSSTSVSDRPSLGLDAKSPKRHGKLRALVDETITTDASYHPEDKESKSADCTKEPSVMSLSTIAQMLQEIDSATPRKLVDQILNANKKKRKQKLENNSPAGETYTLLPANRTSLPISSSTFLTNEKPEKDTKTNSFGSKLSLDSKSINEMYNKSINEMLKDANFLDSKLKKLLEMNLDDTLPNTTEESSDKTDDQLFIHQSQEKSPNASVPRAEHSLIPRPRQLSQLSNIHNKFSNSVSIKNESSLIHDTGPSEPSEPTMTINEAASKEDTLTESIIKNQSFDTKKVEIGKKTQELCTCLVGIPKETDFELCNGTDRWILCSLRLQQIQGEKDNIELNLPDKDILIEPDARKSFKIGVKMPRMGKLIIVILQIPCCDMVTRTSWYMKHLMCFVPEKPDIKISLPSKDNTLDFQMITEDTSNSLPITLENQNSIDVPISLCLHQDKPELFNISDSPNDTINSVSNQRKSVYLTLLPKKPVTVNISFTGISLQSLGEKVLKKGVYNAAANISISICFKENEDCPENETCLIKKVSLKGVLGVCKLDVLDTQFPLVFQSGVNRLISLKNSGSIAVSATADVVQSKDNQSESRDFFICPNNIILHGGENLSLQISYKPENNKTDNERHAMIKITVGNKVSFYPIIGRKELEPEQISSLDSFQQFQRCETPQHLRSICSPTSPHSLIFNRSGTSGRYSPGSTASGGTVAGTSVPIRATHTALVWGSVKAGKSDTKQFTIRNTSNSKIKLFVTVKAENQNFKLFKDRHTITSTMVLSLQGMESKTLSVIYSPNFPKAAAGKVIFSHYSSSLLESHKLTGLVKVIQLFGYGGCGKIEISEAVKDTSGQMWLSLGKLSTQRILHGKIKLHNTGDLSCFAKIKLIPKALHPSVILSWNVEPTELLLAPNEVQWVSIEFSPRKDDLTTINQTGIIHVGTLKITHGDEPTRLRIRRLYNKLKDSGQWQDKANEQGDEFKEVIHPISKAFPGEVFTQDLKLIGDSVQNLGDLCKGIVQNEVKLTIEIPTDETIQDNLDDSQVFYSLCSDHDTESNFGESFLPID